MSQLPESTTESSAQRQLSRRQQIAMGVVFVLAGVLPMALGSGLIVPKADPMNAPGWLVFVAGSCFSLVGLVFILPERAIRLRGFVGGLFVTTFATLFLWIGFGPGERQFRDGISIGAVSSWSSGSEIGGRVVFGSAGVLIAAFAVWAWIKWLRSCVAPRSGSNASD